MHYVPTGPDAPPSPDWPATNLAVMDSVWTTIVDQMGYRAPVLLGTPYLLEAGLQRREGRKLFVRAQGTDEGCALVVEANAVFVVVGREHFARGGGDVVRVAP